MVENAEAFIKHVREQKLDNQRVQMREKPSSLALI